VDYAAGPGAAGIVADDFNADGKLDLAVANAATPITFRDSGLVSILLGNGDGTFQAHVDISTMSLRPLELTTGDFEGRGVVDLAVTTNLSTRGSVSILKGHGDGMFHLTNSYSTGRLSRHIALDDLNLDGIPDFAVANFGANSVTILKGKGDGTFASQSHYGVGLGPLGLVTGDFDGDGAPDLVVVNLGSSTVSVFLSKLPAPLASGARVKRP
jgi:hypothetical protein